MAKETKTKKAQAAEVEEVEQPAVEPKEAPARPAKARNEAEPQRLDETVPGGVYIVGGVKVNAHGKPIGEQKEEGEE